MLATAFLAGAAAGLAIAMPFGAISILIVETGLRRGRGFGWAAGAGAATADSTYTTLAALFGSAMAVLVAPIQVPMRVVAAVALTAIGVRGIVSASQRARRPPTDPHLERLDETTLRRTYLQFVALTLANPATVIYFAALILGLPVLGTEVAARLVFVLGVAIASLSWQILLGTAGAVIHHRVSGRSMALLSLAGYVVILGIAANVAMGVLRA